MRRMYIILLTVTADTSKSLLVLEVLINLEELMIFKSQDLRFKYVNAATKQRLKKREKPKSAMTQIQYHFSSVNMPLATRSSLPAVLPGNLWSKLSWKKYPQETQQGQWHSVHKTWERDNMPISSKAEGHLLRKFGRKLGQIKLLTFGNDEST